MKFGQQNSPDVSVDVYLNWDCVLGIIFTAREINLARIGVVLRITDISFKSLGVL